MNGDPLPSIHSSTDNVSDPLPTFNIPSDRQTEAVAEPVEDGQATENQAEVAPEEPTEVKETTVAEKKTCPRCGKTKPIDDFPVVKKDPDGTVKQRRFCCGPCWSDYQSEYRANKAKEAGQAAPKKRGRKPKVEILEAAAVAQPERRKVGRPRKIQISAPAPTDQVATRAPGRPKAASPANGTVTTTFDAVPSLHGLVAQARANLKAMLGERSSLDNRIKLAEKYVTKLDRLASQVEKMGNI
jgi:hypothetical protein